MEYRSYNRELAYANILFKRLFSNIAIERDGKLVRFKCLIGNRSRIFKNLENPQKAAQYTLPMIIVQRTGITKNDERLANVWNEIKYRDHSSRLNYNLFTPVPIDISYDVVLISKNQGDIDMALSNFIPFFNKDLYVSGIHPVFKDLQYTSQVVMENGIQEEHPDELSPTDDDLVVATCQFTFKTFIFCGNGRSRIKTAVRNQISTYLSSVHYNGVSSYLTTFGPEDFDGIRNEITKGTTISAFVTRDVDIDIQVQLSAITSSEISVSENPFSSPIENINIGFYATSTLSSHRDFMQEVDTLSAVGVNDNPYVDRFIYAATDGVDNLSWERLFNANDPGYPVFD